MAFNYNSRRLRHCPRSLDQNLAGTQVYAQFGIRSVKEDKMSVEIETSVASNMSESLSSLKETPLAMHRVWFNISSLTTWYTIVAEANALYGRNWRGQSHVRRKLDNNWYQRVYQVWFEVPDPSFSTWVAVKHAVIATTAPGK